MSDLRAYHNDPAFKAALIGEILKHEQADQLVKGTYGEMNDVWRGCAIGCALHALNILQGKTGEASVMHTTQHRRYEAELGLPAWLAYLEDHIFERLPSGLFETWPRRFAEAIPVGAIVGDVVLAKILRWTLIDATYGVRHATTDDRIKGHIDDMIAGFDAEIASDGHATWAAWVNARDAWVAWVVLAAWDVGFYQALSDEVLTQLAQLSGGSDGVTADR